jgi:hypothetical protein
MDWLTVSSKVTQLSSVVRTYYDSCRGFLGCDILQCCIHLQDESPPKRRYPTTTLHGVTTQKTSKWIFIAAKSSDLAINCDKTPVVYLNIQKVRVRFQLPPLILKWKISINNVSTMTSNHLTMAEENFRNVVYLERVVAKSVFKCYWLCTDTAFAITRQYFSCKIHFYHNLTEANILLFKLLR